MAPVGVVCCRYGFRRRGLLWAKLPSVLASFITTLQMWLLPAVGTWIVAGSHVDFWRCDFSASQKSDGEGVCFASDCYWGSKVWQAPSAGPPPFSSCLFAGAAHTRGMTTSGAAPAGIVFWSNHYLHQVLLVVVSLLWAKLVLWEGLAVSSKRTEIVKKPSRNNVKLAKMAQTYSTGVEGLQQDQAMQ